MSFGLGNVEVGHHWKREMTLVLVIGSCKAMLERSRITHGDRKWVGNARTGITSALQGSEAPCMVIHIITMVYFLILDYICFRHSFIFDNVAYGHFPFSWICLDSHDYNLDTLLV